MVTETEVENMGEDDAAGGETESLRRENDRLSRELTSREASIAGLEEAITGKDGEIVALKQAVVEVERRAAELGGELSRAVMAYRETAVAANSGVLADLIKGDTIEEVNESLKNARSLVDRVRREVETEASKTRIPAGAPQRVPPDLSALSPREKIQYAIGGSV